MRVQKLATHPLRFRTSWLLLAVLIASGAAAACASGGGGGGGPDRPRRSANLITAEELAEFSTYTAQDAIRRLRPRWLTTRGDGYPQIIIDGARMGSPDALSSISVSDVESMRFLSAADATMRFGTNFPNGAIEVTSRSR